MDGEDDDVRKRVRRAARGDRTNEIAALSGEGVHPSGYL